MSVMPLVKCRNLKVGQKFRYKRKKYTRIEPIPGDGGKIYYAWTEDGKPAFADDEAELLVEPYDDEENNDSAAPEEPPSVMPRVDKDSIKCPKCKGEGVDWNKDTCSQCRGWCTVPKCRSCRGTGERELDHVPGYITGGTVPCENCAGTGGLQRSADPPTS